MTEHSVTVHTDSSSCSCTFSSTSEEDDESEFGSSSSGSSASEASSSNSESNEGRRRRRRRGGKGKGKTSNIIRKVRGEYGNFDGSNGGDDEYEEEEDDGEDGEGSESDIVSRGDDRARELAEERDFNDEFSVLEIERTHAPFGVEEYNGPPSHMDPATTAQMSSSLMSTQTGFFSSMLNSGSNAFSSSSSSSSSYSSSASSYSGMPLSASSAGPAGSTGLSFGSVPTMGQFGTPSSSFALSSVMRSSQPVASSPFVTTSSSFSSASSAFASSAAASVPMSSGSIGVSPFGAGALSSMSGAASSYSSTSPSSFSTSPSLSSAPLPGFGQPFSSAVDASTSFYSSSAPVPTAPRTTSPPPSSSLDQPSSSSSITRKGSVSSGMSSSLQAPVLPRPNILIPQGDMGFDAVTPIQTRRRSHSQAMPQQQQQQMAAARGGYGDYYVPLTPQYSSSSSSSSSFSFGQPSQSPPTASVSTRQRSATLQGKATRPSFGRPSDAYSSITSSSPLSSSISNNALSSGAPSTSAPSNSIPLSAWGAPAGAISFLSVTPGRQKLQISESSAFAAPSGFSQPHSGSFGANASNIASARPFANTPYSSSSPRMSSSVGRSYLSHHSSSSTPSSSSSSAYDASLTQQQQLMAAEAARLQRMYPSCVSVSLLQTLNTIKLPLLRPIPPYDSITPLDIIPFTRRPLFLIVDSDGSKQFSAKSATSVRCSRRCAASADRLMHPSVLPPHWQSETAELSPFHRFGQPVVILMSPSQPLFVPCYYFAALHARINQKAPYAPINSFAHHPDCPCSCLSSTAFACPSSARGSGYPSASFSGQSTSPFSSLFSSPFSTEASVSTSISPSPLKCTCGASTRPVHLLPYIPQHSAVGRLYTLALSDPVSAFLLLSSSLICHNELAAVQRLFPSANSFPLHPSSVPSRDNLKIMAKMDHLREQEEKGSLSPSSSSSSPSASSSTTTGSCSGTASGSTTPFSLDATDSYLLCSTPVHAAPPSLSPSPPSSNTPSPVPYCGVVPALQSGNRVPFSTSPTSAACPCLAHYMHQMAVSARRLAENPYYSSSASSTGSIGGVGSFSVPLSPSANYSTMFGMDDGSQGEPMFTPHLSNLSRIIASSDRPPMAFSTGDRSMAAHTGYGSSSYSSAPYASAGFNSGSSKRGAFSVDPELTLFPRSNISFETLLRCRELIERTFILMTHLYLHPHLHLPPPQAYAAVESEFGSYSGTSGPSSPSSMRPLDYSYLRLCEDPFLRHLVLRHVLLVNVLHMHIAYHNAPAECFPSCNPTLPDWFLFHPVWKALVLALAKECGVEGIYMGGK